MDHPLKFPRPRTGAAEATDEVAAFRIEDPHQILHPLPHVDALSSAICDERMDRGEDFWPRAAIDPEFLHQFDGRSQLRVSLEHDGKAQRRQQTEWNSHDRRRGKGGSI